MSNDKPQKKFAMKFNGQFFSSETNLTQRIQTLIIGRLLTIFLPLVTNWFWQSGQLKLSFEMFPFKQSDNLWKSCL